MNYPAMLYHPSGKAVVVASDVERAMLPEWASTPFTDTCSQAPDVVRLADVVPVVTLPEPVITDALSATVDSTPAVDGAPKRGRPRKVVD